MLVIKWKYLQILTSVRKIKSCLSLTMWNCHNFTSKYNFLVTKLKNGLCIIICDSVSCNFQPCSAKLVESKCFILVQQSCSHKYWGTRLIFCPIVFFSKDQIKNRLRKATIKFDLVAYCRCYRICPVLLIALMKSWRMCCNSLLHCTQSKKKPFGVCLCVHSNWLFFLRLMISIGMYIWKPLKRKIKNEVFWNTCADNYSPGASVDVDICMWSDNESINQ